MKFKITLNINLTRLTFSFIFVCYRSIIIPWMICVCVIWCLSAILCDRPIPIINHIMQGILKESIIFLLLTREVPLLLYSVPILGVISWVSSCGVHQIDRSTSLVMIFWVFILPLHKIFSFARGSRLIAV